MSGKIYNLPDLILFDDFYAWLREFVDNPEARQEVMKFVAADQRFFEETGCHYLDNHPDGIDPECQDAYDAYRDIADSVMNRHGWPTLFELYQAGYDNKLCSKLTPGRNPRREKVSFASMGAMIIKGGLPEDFWEPSLRGIKVDIDNKESVRNFLKKWQNYHAKSGNNNVLVMKIDFGGE